MGCESSYRGPRPENHQPASAAARMTGTSFSRDGRVKRDVPEILIVRARASSPGFSTPSPTMRILTSLVHEACRLEKRPDTLREPHGPSVDNGERVVPAELSRTRRARRTMPSG